MLVQENKPSRLVPEKAVGLCQYGGHGDTKQSQYSITEQECKELLCEVHGDPADRKSLNKSWDTRKRYNEVLASSFRRLSCEYGRCIDGDDLSPAEVTAKTGIVEHLGDRSERVSNCGSTLEFWKALNGSDRWRLHKANFCRDRMCPVCVSRRSLKVFYQLSDVLNHMEPDAYTYLFLTLTVRNCEGSELDSVCDRLLKSFTRMCRHKKLKSVIKGYFRALEVTFNHNHKSESYMTFHPHLHVILAVPRSYFKKGYIRQPEWLQIWRDAYGDQSITQVDIRKIKSKDVNDVMLHDADLLQVGLNKAIAETAKYSIKSSDYLFPKNNRLTDFAVMHLSRALKGLRLFAMGGVFADVAKDLNQDDVMSDDADLIHVRSDDVLNPMLAYMVVRFRWGGDRYDLLSVGLNNSSECEVL